MPDLRHALRRLEQRLAKEARAGRSGIIQATLSNVAPLSPDHWSSLFPVEGRPEEKDFIPRAVAAGAGNFEVLRTSLRRGRLLTGRDGPGAPGAAVISESLARRSFPDSDPLGRRFTADWRKPRESSFEIVGAVADIDLHDPRAAATASVSGFPTGSGPSRRRRLWCRRGWRTPARPLPPRPSCGAPSPTLIPASLTGLCGMLARDAAARKLVRPGPLATAGGATFGVAVLLLIQPWLAPLLAEAGPTEPAIILCAAAFLFAVAALAALLPARRAAPVDPAGAPRWE